MGLSAVGKLTDNWAVSGGFTTMNASVIVATGADNDAVPQLSGTYPNMLRQWAES